LMARLSRRARSSRRRAGPRPLRATGCRDGRYPARRQPARAQGLGPDADPLARRTVALRLRAARPTALHVARNRRERGARREAACGRDLGVLALAPDRLPAGDGSRGAAGRGARVARTCPGPGRGAPSEAAGEPHEFAGPMFQGADVTRLSWIRGGFYAATALV